uniref:hypothetical protein n=1 Tax=Castellaniella defragrans TaxID=75697 RepID=UPI00333F02DA
MSLQYIRNTYGVPAKRGGRIEYTGNGSKIQGTITGSRGARILVRLDGDKGSVEFHPTRKIQYLDADVASSGAAGASMKETQRADFEAFAVDHYRQFGHRPNLTRSEKQPHNYVDANVNALWWGWQAGQDALLARIERGGNG